MSKHAKKGVSPSLADAWLDGLGFYRKNVAYDETCLFRAVSEQLYSCQVHHQKCRQQIIDNVRENWEQFEFILPKNKLFQHLDLLEKHMVVCGNLEIQMISKTYKRNIIIFKANHQMIEKVSQIGFDETLRLCLMGNDHYDAVYNKDYIQSAGFCQSVVYSLLYEKVFDMKDVSEIVNTMLNSNTFIIGNCNNNNLSRDDNTRRKNSNRYYKSSKNKDVLIESEYKHMLETKITPFAFRVAKSLDANIYRNIEYDTWIEMRKEMRLGSWYYGDENLIRGTKCLLKSSDGILQCYIQDFEKHNDQCVVYITSLAEKRVVKYTDLNPEPDAKPWPLPYRFAARSSTPIAITNEVLPPNDLNNYNNNNIKDKKEVTKQSTKNNKNNKRNQRTGNRNVPPLMLPKTDLNDNNIKNFEGSPLQMQTPEQLAIQSCNESTNLEPQSTLYQPQTFHQHQTPWIDQISDHQQLCSESTFFNISQDSLFPSPPEVSQWSIISDTQPQETIPQPSPVVLLPHTPYPNYYEQQLQHSPLIPVTPLPSVPLFQPVYQSAPVTPLIYTTSQDCGGQEVLVMSPQTADSYSRMFPSGYNPPIDMSFLSPPYVFPSAGTPTGYYGAPIDAQGFVFPTPITPQK